MHHRTNRNDLHFHQDEDEDDDFSSDEESVTEDLYYNNRSRTGGTQSRVEYFTNSTGFEINGGDFSSVNGNAYYIRSPPSSGLSPSAMPQRPGTRPIQSSSVKYFEGASNFKITNGNFQAIGGDLHDYSSESQSSSPSRGVPPRDGGLRPQTNESFRIPRSPISSHTMTSGSSGSLRPPSTAQRPSDNGMGTEFTNGKGSHSPKWKNDTSPAFSDESLLRISQECAIRYPSPGMPAPEASDEFSMELVVDGLEGGQHNTSFTNNQHSGRISGDFSQTATSTTVIGAIHRGASTSSAPNLLTAANMPSSPSIMLQNNTMRADAPSSFSQEDINPPTVLGPGPNRDASSEELDTQQGDNPHSRTSTEIQNMSTSSGTVRGKSKGLVHRVLRKVGKKGKIMGDT